MRQTKFPYSLLFFVTILLFGYGCGNAKKETPLFKVLAASQTGLHFTNQLTPTDSFNMFTYMYFYNGAGVGAGDFNNDGWIDLFFSANQGENKLYLNRGELKFEEVTGKAKIPQDGGWSTGVSVADVNNDGLLDIYVCKVGNFESLKGKNQLLICQGLSPEGVPVYTDKASEYGLDFSGFSTQAAFFDYDMDGDLDMFLLNHSVHQNGTFAARHTFLGTYHPLSGDRIYRNDGHRFTDVTRQTGIHSSAISYGLGIAVSDINLDGYPDLYIGNDFHENDYLYINQRNGTFKDETTDRLMHTSQFSMGVDVADVNNDAYPEIISMDMLPSDPYILKRSLGEDAFDIFHMKISYGYNHQYARNNLQLNRGNNLFSEVGCYAGVAATDWSWAPLWMDFNLDGKKDLFISNGIPKRLNDIDYVSYVSNEEIQNKIRSKSLAKKEMSLIEKFPQIKLPNKFYLNRGGVQFTDMDGAIEGDRPSYSNGAAYADFDNDGDLDIVVNNIEDEVSLYQNNTNGEKKKPFLQLTLKGPPANRNAVGARAVFYSGGSITTYEKYPVKGFLSSMEIPLLVGLDGIQIDSAFLIWPDNTYEPLRWKKEETTVNLAYRAGLPLFNYESLASAVKNTTVPIEDITHRTGLLFRHEENPFVEFDREPLIPYMVSKEGPALAVSDINGDGLDDVFIGSSKRTKSALFLQQKDGRFYKSRQEALDKDSTGEDVDAAWADVNNDGLPDLIVASGGNEYYGTDSNLLPRLYLNDGKGHLKKGANAFPPIYLTASCIVPYDFTGDGYVDLFIGGRAVPWEYGQVPASYLLENNKRGGFKDVTVQYNQEVSTVGMVTHAQWTDLEGDKDKDLLLALEWGGITAFINNNGSFTKKPLTNKKGWWNFTLPVDVDKDGDLDIVAGNLGLNSRLQASDKEPVKLYYNDFDGNGKKEQVLTYYLQGREFPFANKDELQRQIPIIKKRFLYAEDFAKASLTDIFTKEKLREANVLTADYFSNVVLINDGKLNFTIQALPPEAQLAPYKDGMVFDANGDSLPDVLLGGNFYENNIQMGRYDADFGTILVNEGRGKFSCQPINGLHIKGQVRRIRKINVGKKEAFILVRNNDSVLVVAKKPVPR